MNIVIDIETNSLKVDSPINFVGFYTKVDGNKEFFKMFSLPSETKELRKFIEQAESKKVNWIGSNVKFDMVRMLYRLGIDLKISHDVQVLTYLNSTVDELKDNKGKWLSLKDTAIRELGVEDWDIGLKDKTSKDPEKVRPYLFKDCKYSFELFELLKKRLPVERRKTYKLIILAMNYVYKHMERTGMPIDMSRLDGVKKEYLKQEKEILNALNEYADINFNSSKQLQHLLFEQLELPVVEYTKKGQPSTGVSALKQLRDKHPIIPHLLKYRENTKGLTFLKTWGEEGIQVGKHHWLHSSFNLTGTVTGRLSSSDVNLQQIPRNPKLKSLFRSTDPDWELVQLDFSQIELRFAALVAGVEKMKEKYRAGEDLHTEMASIITKKVHKDITKVERNQAKAANFGYLYGMMADSFVEYARDTYGVTVTVDQAHQIRDNYFQAYPELLDYYANVENTLFSTGVITSIMQREYQVNMFKLQNPYKQQEILRAAINFPVQSAASDYVLCSLIDVMSNTYITKNIKPCATIHDSIIILVRKSELANVLPKIKHTMENSQLARQMVTVDIDIPIVVDIEIGPFGRGVSLEEYMEASND